MKKLLTLSALFWAITTSQSYATNAVSPGVATGISIDLPMNLFVEGDVFSNYYGDNEIKYNYGVKGDFGYKILGISAYALAGVQHSHFNNNQSKSLNNFSNSSSPIYGVGIGYNFPILPLGVRLENTHFTLDKVNGGKDNFGNTNLSLILIF